MKATAAVLLSLAASIAAAPVDPSPASDGVAQTGAAPSIDAVDIAGSIDPKDGATDLNPTSVEDDAAATPVNVTSTVLNTMANSNSTMDGINGQGVNAPQRYTDAEQGLLDFANAATLGILGTVLKAVNALTGGAVNFGLSVANGVTLGLVGNPVAGSTVKIPPKVGVPAANQATNVAGPSADQIAEALLGQLGVTNVGPGTVTITH
ncbi:hypothetical protein NQ176_g1310 [Zarea fungicola]|uniref:Uncharacterized protein n=1 Tax=Zarea fungicola TaxID=93591 RepID=A0ACC1NUU1_9HYPO|nr:hypothetical protein NQ176_g1310 [Lecanicillium fungicola]